MTPAVSKFLDYLNRRVPRPTVSLVPGDCFYGHTFEVPPEITESDMAAFAELALEGVAPFPLEQLAWGFLHTPGKSRIFVYAAPFVRLRREGVEDMEGHYHVFPSFVTLFGQSHARKTVTFVAHNAVLSALFHDAGSPVPTRVFSKRLPQERPTDDDLRAARKELIPHLKSNDYHFDESVWRLTAQHVQGDTICFDHVIVGPEGVAPRRSTHTMPLDSASVWHPDIRDAAFAELTRKRRSKAARAWSAMVAAICFLGLLIFLQGSLFGFNKWNDSRAERYESRTDAVARIAENHDLLGRIESFAQQELKPFSMLEPLNRNRPAGIHFRRAQSRGWNQLEVEGQGTSVDEVNRYASRLRESDQIRDVEIRSIQSRANVAPFSIVFTFEDLPHLNWVAPPASESAASGRGGDQDQSEREDAS